ncbi:hypothetical protein ACIQXQ_09390 [Peribacillus sp. NPDC097198]|uniref:hypothetical protein n=1 Tax=Peribacillus sp. NPDC097198 TaxID=3364397 RepID=UPI003813AFC9
MLVNGKMEELKKYSKNTYDKQAFVEEVKNNWDLTDLQIRMTYLISDLAVKADGVFSIAYNTFVNMFERRFSMKISLSSVRRFFNLLSKIGVLSVNAAKRKNNKQSANIYIVENVKNEIAVEEKLNENHEHPEEQAYEHHEEHHNIPLTKPLTKPLNNNPNFNCNCKESDIERFKSLLTNAANEMYPKFSLGRWSKKQWNTLITQFVNDTITSGRYKNVSDEKIQGFAYRCLEKIVSNSDYKRSQDFYDYQQIMSELAQNKSSNETNEEYPFVYNWLEN